MQQYNLTYSGIVLINTSPSLHFMFCFFSYESQLINVTCSMTEILSENKTPTVGILAEFDVSFFEVSLLATMLENLLEHKTVVSVAVIITQQIHCDSKLQ